MFSTNLNDWSESHVFYNTWSNNLTAQDEPAIEAEMLWRKFVLERTPNGKLFIQNKLFEQLQNNEIYLAHITPNLHNILRKNLIYPSGGCLVGSIYCVPVDKTPKGFRLHNLGSFIYNKEIPKIVGIDPQILLAKINLPDCSKNKLIGIDYLRLGKIHFDLFKELEYLLSGEERYSLEKICTNRVQELLPLLVMVQNKFLNQKVDLELFFKLYFDQIDKNPILAYILFEVFCEFIVLYQKSKLSEKWKRSGEIYSWHFKNAIYEFANNKSFDLRTFKPNFKEIQNYIKKEKCAIDINSDEIQEYFFNRITFLLYDRFWNNNSAINDWRKLLLTFDNLAVHFKPLLGHIIHRELRNFGRYPNFYYYFDQLKALEVWNYWNHLNIAVPFNGLIPKGEVGINPAFPDLKFEMYKTDVRQKSDEIFITPKEKITAQLVPRLVDLKFTNLRNKHYGEENGDYLFNK